ncbi:sulfate/molybdate ABC transporter ATP-binding protein [Agromyces sp. S2-1-8]|uniref:sulfate/molybdate ABC transporter ATP-binding protein n=1 Tax=Agromyces sp. S2-1-8 TaxID=2897180 RepID=UPI001E4D70B0|nr:ABC transporter ATP-binding protein [Agromyces sp. S2-1-8]MCD5347989.1 ABC transporter ATP-binding protein [Agromyces sp. S2-1-8]
MSAPTPPRTGAPRSGDSIAATPAGALDVDVHVEAGSFALGARLVVEPGDVLAVLGPNGSGKSTLLGTIAGHVVPSHGHVRLGARALTDLPADDGADGRRRIALPPADRCVGLLGQHALVFPHLSARENIAFGPRARGVPARTARAAADDWLARVGLDGLGDRRPSELSGGQQQRVALARTLAAEPDVLLLDEPFAALDVEAAASMRRLVADELARLEAPAVLVTHDPLDAIVLARRAAILHDGAIVDEGPTGEVLGHPRTPFIAALAGVNLVTGVAATADRIVADGLELRGVGALRPGSPASAVFSPAAVHVAPEASVDLTEPNRWLGTVALVEPAPGGVRIHVAEHPSLAADVPSSQAVALDLGTGSRLAFAVAEADVSLRAER